MENSSTTNTPPQVFSPECIDAVKTFRAAKPWRGNLEERKAKFGVLHLRLCDAYGLKHGLAFADDLAESGNDGCSRFEMDGTAITLHYKLSVVTYLVAVGVARGFNYSQAWTWASELYCKMFPLSALRHVLCNGFFVRNPNL